MPKVSVVVANYNNAQYLPECLNSLIGQSYADFEVLVFDDSSTDNSRELIAEYAAKDHRIKLIALPQNLGVAHLRSIALAHCSGEYIAVLDADDVSHPDRLQLQAHHLGTNPEVVLVASYAAMIDAESKVLQSCMTIPTTDDVLRWRLLSGNCFVHSTLMFRKEAALNAGAYNAEMSCAEDMDLISRIMLQGKLAAIPRILSSWRSHQVSYTQQALDKILAGTFAIIQSNAQRILGLSISHELAQALHSSQAANPQEFEALLDLTIRYHEHFTQHEPNPHIRHSYHRLCLGSLLKIRKQCRNKAWFPQVRPVLRAAFLKVLRAPDYHWLWDANLRVSLRKRIYLLALRYKLNIG